MKLDYKLLKKILMTLEEHENFLITTEELREKIYEEDNQEEYNIFASHLIILGDNNYLYSDSENLGFKYSTHNEIFTVNATIRLTAQGYQFLDILKDENIFKRITKFSISTAFEVGKNALTQLIVDSIK